MGDLEYQIFRTKKRRRNKKTKLAEEEAVTIDVSGVTDIMYIVMSSYLNH